MRKTKLPFMFFICCNLFLFPVGCGDESNENATYELGDFLVGMWRLNSISCQGVTVACPGEIEIEEGVRIGCGEMTSGFLSGGFFRMDLFQFEVYSRMEGAWRLAHDELVLEITKRGESDTGPVGDESMQTLESPVTFSFSLQRSGDSLQMTEIGMPVPVTAVYKRSE